MNDLLAKFTGCLVGLAVGDSLGARRQGAGGEAADLAPRHTDDTVQALGVAESLAELGEFHYWHMAENLIKHYEREPWRRYGNTVTRVFRMMRTGRLGFGMLDRDIFPDGSYGSGAVARVSPVGLFYYDDPKMLREIAYHCASITHSHELAQEGAVVHACAVALSVLADRGEVVPSEFLAPLRLITGSAAYQEKLKLVVQFLEEGCSRKDVIERLGSGGAVNTVPAAIYAVLANKDFKSALLYAADLGGTAETLCALTGAIAGARFGIEGVPSQWQATVENGEGIGKLAKRLAEARANRRPGP